ncbi:MAG: GxxExxY protein [Candidatus Magasanikbacteria bacterium]|jgi:GxxExxY protein|nr:GxxExxY protein [Candidatus Magasanikbacteria bacterium]MBT4314595.1 GxxExxY protein [Candidatus Magasanikbacteria bacterium]MBT4546772.1 GxxExxY protein [Candidatus Magasanikbacteria bacterium]MBT6819619.1 GxxExxY protein [Candidatus Magasanikbacteria bacterium]
MHKESDLTKKIIGLAMQVHNEIGPGYQESIYHNAMIVILEKEGYMFETEKEIDVFFQKKLVGSFRLDLLIENRAVVELKAVVGEMPKIFKTQTISYLKASNIEVGLLINFGNPSLDVKRLARYHNYNQYESV